MKVMLYSSMPADHPAAHTAPFRKGGRIENRIAGSFAIRDGVAE